MSLALSSSLFLFSNRHRSPRIRVLVVMTTTPVGKTLAASAIDLIVAPSNDEPERIMIRRFFAAAAFLLIVDAADARTTWTDAIARVERSAEAYREYARAREVTWAGSLYDGLDHTRHSCAIIGRMIGQTDAIAEIEKLDYPELKPDGDEDYAHEMLVFSISLDNWVSAAQSALAMSETQRINLWNLDCARSQTCSACPPVESAAPQADFVHEGSRLFVLGDIDAGFADRLEKALDAATEVEEVLLGSNGGNVIDAMRAGFMIRKRGLTTTLYGNCNSACPLVFLGGTKRIVWASTARFGLHQISRNGSAIALDDEMYKIVARYVRALGGDPDGVVSWMMAAPPERLAFPEVDDYCELGLATWVQRVCGF